MTIEATGVALTVFTRGEESIETRGKRYEREARMLAVKTESRNPRSILKSVKKTALQNEASGRS